MITVNADQIARAEVLLKNVPNGVTKALVAALNRAAEGARSDAVRKVRERYYIKAADVRDAIKIKKATPDDLAAIVHAKGSPIALSKFRLTPSKPPTKRRTKPIIARVVRGEGGPIKGAFVARMASGHVGAFIRAGTPRRREEMFVRVGGQLKKKKVKDLPIQQLYGPSLPQMLGHKSVTEFVEEQARERLESRLEHEIDRLLRGVGK